MATTKSSKALTKKKVVMKKSAVKKVGTTLSTNGKKVTFIPTKLKLLRPVPSDIEIAQAGKLKPILQIASELGIRENELELFGPYKARSNLRFSNRLARRPNGKYIDVTAITPTPLGEGKTTTTVGVSQALGAYLGKACHYCYPPAFSGTNFRHQRWCSRWGLFSDHPDGRFQPAPYRRHPCHHAATICVPPRWMPA